jgi:hypothetical protein
MEQCNAVDFLKFPKSAAALSTYGGTPAPNVIKNTPLTAICFLKVIFKTNFLCFSSCFNEFFRS